MLTAVRRGGHEGAEVGRVYSIVRYCGEIAQRVKSLIAYTTSLKYSGI